jgi:hypothetical protein
VSDPLATAVDELRAECQANTTGEVSRTVSVDIEPHGARDVSIAVAPMEGTDGRWFLEVSIRRGRNLSQQWLKAGSREQVIEVLESAEMVGKVTATAKEIADADFHTEGLPERW